jgi:EAL domain-containing protein (putative c-di-GMP-specific phosphodiesterase class I)/GGDEF domain-containing protein
MSLINQIRIAIFLVILTTASGVLLFSTLDSKRYIAEELQKKNADNANVLALSMSQMDKEPTLIDLFLSAQFDIGHYRYIGLYDVDGKVLSERTNPNSRSAAPQWFIRHMRINASPGTAIIQDGWKQYGTIHVESDVNFAYDRLWNGIKNMLTWVLSISLISYIACGYLLNKILHPLEQVIAQARAMGERRFITITAPKTPEFKALVDEMNLLSTRVQETVNSESARLEALRMKTNYDDLTRLMNHDYFLNMVSSRVNHESYKGGSVVLLRLINLAELNELIGYSSTNDYLRQISQLISEEFELDESVITGRLNGTDFAIFIEQQIDDFALANLLKDKLMQLNQQFTSDAKPYCVITSTKVNKIEDSTHLFNALDFILELSSLNGDASPIRVINANSIVDSKQHYLAEWKNSLNDAIKANRIKLVQFPVIYETGHLLHYESPARLQIDEEGKWLSAGEFIDWATQLNLIDAIDQLVLENAVGMLSQNQTPICLNVSESAMRSSEYLRKILDLVNHSDINPKLLSFEVSEIAAFNHLAEFKTFCLQVRSFGCQVGVEHMNLRIGRLGELHDLGLNYIKFDSSLVRNIHINERNQTLLRGLCLVTHSMGIMTIAEGVQQEAEKAVLFEIGLDAITGPSVRLPKT